MSKSTPLPRFIRDHLKDGQRDTYSISEWIFVNNGRIIEGNDAGNELKGTSKNDILWGNKGDIALFGGNGRDLLVSLSHDGVMHGGAGDDRLQGWGGDDNLFGGSGKDALYGGQGDDVLKAGAGFDYLCGGSGNDVLIGGAGTDSFLFRPELNAEKSNSTYIVFDPTRENLRIEDYLLPEGKSISMIKAQADGDLYIQTSGGHRLTIENLDWSDIRSLYESIELI